MTMNLSNTMLCAAAMAAVAGCASPSDSEAHREPVVKPGLIMLTADQAARRGLCLQPPAPTTPPAELHPLDASAVVAPPGIKVYTVARTVDPFDPETLHERHVVYRRESTAAWRLDAAPNQELIIGPRVSDGRDDLRPLLDKEVLGFIADQRRLAEANRVAIATLFQAVDALNRQQQALIRPDRDRSTHPAVNSAAPGPETPAIDRLAPSPPADPGPATPPDRH